MGGVKGELPAWTGVPPDIITQHVGFVYLITSPCGKKYIGKKLFFSSIRRKPLKGTKRARRCHKESDWRKYFGSSKELMADLENTDPMEWRREILHLCDSRWEMSLMEMKEQMERDVLFRDDFYNGIVHCRLGKPPASFLAKRQARIDMERQIVDDIGKSMDMAIVLQLSQNIKPT
jgi:hypothetical protein